MNSVEYEKNRLIKFIIITFGITGIAWGGLAILTKLSIISFTHPIGTILHIIGGFGPTVATLFVLEEKLTFKSILIFVFRSKKKSMIYFLIFVILEIVVIGISSMELNSALPM